MKRKKIKFLSENAVKNVFYCLVGVLVFALTVGLSGCGDKDDDDGGGIAPPDPDAVELLVSPTTLSLGLQESQDVTITQGNGGYAVSVTDATVISAALTGTVVKVTGLKAGSATATIKDKGGKSQAISVTVKANAVDGQNNINTAVKYNMTVLSGEVGQGNGWTNETKAVKNTTIITRRDFLNNKNTEDINSEALGTLGEFFATISDNDVFVCGGYYENGDLDMGYAAPALKLTDRDDANNPGCKVIEVITSNLAAKCQWPNYTSKGGTAFYNTTDKSFTIKVSGYLGWGMTFTYSRKYTPAN